MISENFARCIAKISGDANLYNHYVRYSNTSSILLEEFRKDIIMEFANINFTEGIVNPRTPFIQTHGKKIIDRFLQYLDSYKSDKVYIPRVIKNGNEKIRKEYLRTLYDDEGCISLRLFNKTREWKRNLNLTSNSLRLLRDVKILLSKYDIKTNKIIRTKPNCDSDKSFTLSITGRKNIIKFRDNVNFKLPYKRKTLNLVIKSYGNTYSRNRRGFENIKKKLSLLE